MKEKLIGNFSQKYDRVFKAVYLDNLNGDFHLLEKLLSECLEYPVKVKKILNPELTVNKTSERYKRLDALIEGNGEKINLELNLNSGLATRARNFYYFTSFCSQSGKVGEEYDAKTKYIQINLNFNNKKDTPKKLQFHLYDKKYKIEYPIYFEILELNIDKYTEFWYDKNIEEMIKSPLMVSLGVEVKDLKEYSQMIEFVETKEVVNKVIKLNSDEEFVYKWSPEEDERMLINTQIHCAKNEGIEEGIQQGLQRGLKESAKNMLQKGFNIKTISEITSLTIDEINQLNK